ncbi:transcription elongation factor GreA [Paenibacillus yanchengensis]|uniref:Transcription elongation factor GreA n=1 Tax=Paenibacillus yanchengensis TaxID=2035833 RepID=A0ABW4YHS9_9BACL
MQDNTTILTKEGLEKIQQELEHLKGPRRKELAQRLKVAIGYGDLKENSEYHSAKEDQAFMETRILTLERMLRTVQVVDQAATGKVGIGSTVVLHDLEFDEELEYRLVGPAEADVINHMISYESPLGKQLFGKQAGVLIKVDAPAGIIQYKLLEVK